MSAVRRNVNKDIYAAKVQAQFRGEIPICLDSYVLVNEAAEHFESPWSWALNVVFLFLGF